ncbi:glycosyl hydrolase family 5 [Paludisphaera soli]|uniref:glycosyl hydrolase family 5 n=1 Tax=Paludisphaera soli TaxID=2712865 RepID=UPI0013EA48E6|nr:glycosyl hydrolase family 5 [Paludisphaera soli]
MRTRLFYALSPIAAAVLAWSLHHVAATGGARASATAAAQAGGRATAAAKPRGPIPEIAAGDWTWMVLPNGSVRVLCKGSVVLESSQAYWGPKWSWSSLSKVEFRREPGGGGSLTAKVEKLKTDVAVEYRSPAPNVVEMEFRLDSAESIPGAVGGGLQWATKPNAAVLGGEAPPPSILPEGAGWSWEPVPGRRIDLKVTPGAARIQPENGARMFLLADRVDAGVKTFRLTLTLPEGATRALTPEERYAPARPEGWFPEALAWDASPLDLRFLNADDRPAGSRGRVRADGDRLVRGDGSPARFWGANLAAYALFTTPRESVATQAKRMAQLGYNLMRIHHHDSSWVTPNIFGVKAPTTRKLDPEQLDKIDWWVKCLKDEGIYVWLDLQVGRTFLDADGLVEGKAEIDGSRRLAVGYSYYNGDVQRLMREFQEAYLTHVNPHTGLAYKDDPAVAAVLVTNENDLAHHFGYMFLANQNRPFHNALFTREVKAFAAEHGLSADEVGKTWVPGPSKMFLGDMEHRFNQTFLGDLRRLGFQGLAATTNYWGNSALWILPSLSDGDLIDVHAYGKAEALDADPRYEANFIPWIGAGQVAGKPLSVTEWNVPYPADDRFTAPLATAAAAAHQGWDAPMIYNYSQEILKRPRGPSTWSTFADPALSGVMPAAALLYRRGHVAPAARAYHLALTPEQLFGRNLSPATSATIRTAVEQSRLTIGLPATTELPWLKPTPTPEGATVLDDPDRDLIPEGQTFVRSDTGEITRDWRRGLQVIDAPKSQAASGWIGGEAIATADAKFAIETKKAVVALTSVDDQPLAKSRFVLITAVARAMADPNKKVAYLSEPVVGTIELKTDVPDLELLALAADGRVAARSRPEPVDGRVRIKLPAAGGTHWYVLKARGAAPATP